MNLLLGENDAPPEALIPKYVLQELCSESAKLKTLGAMESIPSNKIIRLLSILEKNIRDGAKVSPIADPVSKNNCLTFRFIKHFFYSIGR